MKKILLFLALTLISIGRSWAAAEVSLTASAEEGPGHSVQRPLLLTLAVSDRAAANERMRAAQDKRLLDAYKATAEYAALTPEEKKKVEDEYTAPASRPAMSLGTAGGSLAALFKFSAVTEKGEAVELKARPLKPSVSAQGPYRADADGTLVLYFGVDAADLRSLEGKELRITAAADPDLRSDTLTLRFIASDGKLKDEEARARLREQGTFYRLDQNWDELDRTAESLISQFPTSADGWTLKGDALLGRGDRAAARETYIKAVELAQKALPQDDKKGPSEAPMYLIRKIEELSS